MKKSGFTLVEMTIVTAIMTAMIVATASLFSNTIRNFTMTTNQIDSDMSASLALQILNRDLQEAKQVQIISSTRIRVYYPQVEAGGVYNRLAIDNVNTIDFYRGRKDGTEDPTSNCMIRSEATGITRPICEDVIDLEFRSISPSSVDVTLKTERRTDTIVRQTEMIHRAIFLRNY